MKRHTIIVIGVIIVIGFIIWGGSFLTVCLIGKPRGSGLPDEGTVEPVCWPVVDRAKCYGEPYDALKYYKAGIGYEQRGDYKRAIENYDIYSQKLGKRRPEVYARALYYSGKRQESARAYFEAIRDMINHWHNLGYVTIKSKDFLPNLMHNVIQPPHDYAGPFTTVDELFQFLNEEENAFLRKEEHFEETMNFLKNLQTHLESQ